MHSLDNSSSSIYGRMDVKRQSKYPQYVIVSVPYFGIKQRFSELAFQVPNSSKVPETTGNVFQMRNRISVVDYKINPPNPNVQPSEHCRVGLSLVNGHNSKVPAYHELVVEKLSSNQRLLTGSR